MTGGGEVSAAARQKAQRADRIVSLLEETMIFIFGGAYQGKLDYAVENFEIETVCDCRDGKEPDFSMDAVCGLEGFVRKCADEDRDATEFFRVNRGKWQDSILIMTDVSQGVVPIDASVRKYREMSGRTMTYLAGEADQVIRVFCGIGKKVK